MSLLQEAANLSTPSRELSELRDEAALCLGDFVGLQPMDIHFDKTVFSIAFSPDSSLLAVGLARGDIRLFEPMRGVETAHLTGHSSVIVGLQFSPSGRQLTSIERNGQVNTWQLGKNKTWTVTSRTNIGLVTGQSPDIITPRETRFATANTFLVTQKDRVVVWKIGEEPNS